MNIERLKKAEKVFLAKYPEGFAHAELLAIGKQVQRMQDQTRDYFAKDKFDSGEFIAEHMVKSVSKSSLVSMFEKLKFRDYVKSLNTTKKETLAKGLYHFLYTPQDVGFDSMCEVLAEGKLAKWTLMTVIPYHFSPQREVFVKPTTTKDVIKQFELRELEYHSQPTFAFYQAYREVIQRMMVKVDSSLAPDCGSFTGFLMVAMQEEAF